DSDLINLNVKDTFFNVKKKEERKKNLPNPIIKIPKSISKLTTNTSQNFLLNLLSSISIHGIFNISFKVLLLLLLLLCVENVSCSSLKSQDNWEGKGIT